MLIIFDLDDTLIDTSGKITPFKLKEGLKRVIEKGFFVKDFEASYETLLQINRTSSNSLEALSSFFGEEGMEFRKIFIDEMKLPLPSDFVVDTTPNAKEILNYLQKKHVIALVTAGSPPFQRQKLEKAGIDTSVFSKMTIPEGCSKKPFYDEIMKEFLMKPADCVVCGDRILVDLLPAYELGMKTVHMRWGRGLKAEKQDWIDAQISDLSELKRIIKQ